MDNLQWRSVIIVTAMITLTASSPVTGDSLMGGHLDNEPTSPSSEEVHHHRPNIPPLAFNGGQPFSLEKDPVTGQIDFGKAPPFKALNYTGSYASDDVHKEESDGENEETENDAIINSKSEEEQQMPNEINPYSPSFHDYLNLPVRYNDHEKYTSDKYPLISSSYANTKVQGGSSGFKIYNSLNHKTYNSINHPGKASTSQSYSNTRTPFVPRTTKRPSTTARTTRATTTSTTTTTTTTTTTARPTTTTRATTVTQKSTTAEPVTTWKPRPVDRYGMEYDEDIMLPIEKMQTSGNGDHFVSFPKFDYEDGYDYLHQEPAAPSSSSSTTSRPSTTTTLRPSTTTIPTTTTIRTTEAPTTEPPRASQSPLVNNQRPSPMNSVVNGHQNYPSFNPDTPQNYPGFNPLAVESASNVIVPPDQDTISFVLGNRQNVQGTYYGHGSAVAESPYGDAVVSPNRMDTNYDHDLKIGVPSPEVQAPQEVSKVPSGFQLPQRDVVSTGQKWWFNNDQSEKTQSVSDNDKDNRVNVGAGYRVVFPTSEPSTSPSPIVSSTEVTTTTIAASSVLGSLGLSELSDVLVPPAVDRPVRPQGHPPSHHQGHPHPQGHPQSHSHPPGRPHYHYHTRPLDLPNRIPRPPNTYKIRPPMDINLPNILPQFRPNVKTSNRRGSDAIETVLISARPPKYPTRVSVRPPMPPPSHRPPSRLPSQPVSPLQRLKPPPPPLPPLPPPIYSLKLPSPEALVDLRGSEDHVPKDVPIRRNAGEGLIDERNRGSQVLKSRLNDESSDKLEGPSLPPRPPVFFKRKGANDTRVTTLQMIQHHGVDAEGSEGENMQGDEPGEGQDNRKVKAGSEDVAPVFVVYPVKGAIGIHADGDDDKHLDESVVVGIHAGERPLPPDTLSISQENEEEEVKVPGKVVILDFPYPLERPDPGMFISPVKERPLLVPNEPTQDDEEEDRIIKDTSINVIPYLQDHVPFAIKPNAISTTLHVGSSPSGASSGISDGSTPIAFVYTPTMRPYQPSGSSEVYERNPVLLPSQQPSSSASSAPSPQNFMAPFFASVSAEVPSRDGWSVVTVRPDKGEVKTVEAEKRVGEEGKGDSEEKGGNSTAPGVDVPADVSDRTKEEGGLQTEASDFDAENFKPQLFGGFQPILEFPTDSAEMPSELRNKEAVGVMDKPRGAKESAPRTSYGD